MIMRSPATQALRFVPRPRRPLVDARSLALARTCSPTARSLAGARSFVLETSFRPLPLLHQGTAVAAGVDRPRGGFGAALLPPVPDEDQQPEEVDVDQYDHDVAHRLVLQRDRVPAAGG